MGLQWRMRPFVTGGFTQQKISQIFQLRNKKKNIDISSLLYIEDILTILGS